MSDHDKKAIQPIAFPLAPKVSLSSPTAAPSAPRAVNPSTTAPSSVQLPVAPTTPVTSNSGSARDASNATLDTTVNPPPDDLIFLGRDPSIVNMDDALGKAFDTYGLPRLGGASGRGWSRIATMQRCMYLYKRRYLDKERGGPSGALEVGSATHTFLALHYQNMREPDKVRLTPERLHRELLDIGADARNVQEAWRLYSAYATRYDDDYLIPLAEEEYATDGDNTCRYDLIARVERGNHTIQPGTWIVEFKTSARFDQSTLEGWRNDGEIIGQIMLYKPAGLTKKYGRLNGVIVSIIGKQKIPKFERVIVPIQAWQSRAHKRDLAFWNSLEQLCAATNTWPRSRAHCTNKYGMCEYFQHCAEKL